VEPLITTYYNWTLIQSIFRQYVRDGAYAVPATKNYASEVSTLGILAGVNLLCVQWAGLTLEEPPIWSRLTSTPGKYARCPFLGPLYAVRSPLDTGTVNVTRSRFSVSRPDVLVLGRAGTLPSCPDVNSYNEWCYINRTSDLLVSPNPVNVWTNIRRRPKHTIYHLHCG